MGLLWIQWGGGAILKSCNLRDTLNNFFLLKIGIQCKSFPHSNSKRLDKKQNKTKVAFISEILQLACTWLAESNVVNDGKD